MCRNTVLYLMFKAGCSKMDAQERGDFSEIPILDVSALYGDDEGAIRATAATLRRYLETIGFLYVTGHPIPRADVEAVRDASKRFFALPEEEKAKLKIDKNFRGYLPFAGSTIVTSSVATVSKPNQSESIFFMHEVGADDPRALAEKPLQGPNQWPDETALAGFRETIEHYVDEMGTLARKMVRAIALSLGLPPTALTAISSSRRPSCGCCTIRPSPRKKASSVRRRIPIMASSPCWRRTMSAASRSRTRPAIGFRHLPSRIPS